MQCEKTLQTSKLFPSTFVKQLNWCLHCHLLTCFTSQVPLKSTVLSPCRSCKKWLFPAPGILVFHLAQRETCQDKPGLLAHKRELVRISGVRVPWFSMVPRVLCSFIPMTCFFRLTQEKDWFNLFYIYIYCSICGIKCSKERAPK